MSTRIAIPKLVVVDLDGTLVDSLPDIAWCVDGMLSRLDLPAAGPEQVRAWVGNGTEVLVRRALAARLAGAVDEQTCARALAIFTRLYAQHTSDRSRVYDGVPAGLDFLHRAGVELACVTNKASAFTHKLLAALELDKHFSLVISGDSLPRGKPDPMPLLHAARHFAVAPEHALHIGDSVNDVKAARAAGFGIVCVTYGYNHGDDIRLSNPDAVIDSLAELPELFATSDRANATG
ncbi:MAG: phosphoglycolate phosphatase [Gammaproteobacteria bacterium]|nr:MAG: phosphoglycolate phosphatase [Gammaproteobacteria bacterium]